MTGQPGAPTAQAIARQATDNEPSRGAPQGLGRPLDTSLPDADLLREQPAHFGPSTVDARTLPVRVGDCA